MQYYITNIHDNNGALVRALGRLKRVNDALAGPRPEKNAEPVNAEQQPLLAALGESLQTQVAFIDAIHSELYRLEELLNLVETASTSTAKGFC